MVAWKIHWGDEMIVTVAHDNSSNQQGKPSMQRKHVIQGPLSKQ